MAVGGEKERKGKKKETRFTDRRRPKPSKAELVASLLKKEGFTMMSSKGSSFKFCPLDGQKLQGQLAKCLKCLEEYSGKLEYERGASVNAVLVDAREFLTFWRRKLFWRMVFPFHAWVVWTTGPPIPIAAFETIFEKTWLQDAYKTSAVKTTIRRLETTRAMEDFCRFENVDSDRGWGAGKVLPNGSILMMVPPMEIVHTDSKLAGSKVTFTSGWVLLNNQGDMVKAENMEMPAQGWEHVESRLRDTAYNMLECGYAVSSTMLSNSEASLLNQHEGNEDEAFQARMKRDVDEAHSNGWTS
jgi:hypothetical protein